VHGTHSLLTEFCNVSVCLWCRVCRFSLLTPSQWRSQNFFHRGCVTSPISEKNCHTLLFHYYYAARPGRCIKRCTPVRLSVRDMEVSSSDRFNNIRKSMDAESAATLLRALTILQCNAVLAGSPKGIESVICRLTRSTTVRRIVQAYCIMLSYVTRVACCVCNFVDL